MARTYTEPRAVLELLKPITWFPPMWAWVRGHFGRTYLRDRGPLFWASLLAGPCVRHSKPSTTGSTDMSTPSTNPTGRYRPDACRGGGALDCHKQLGPVDAGGLARPFVRAAAIRPFDGLGLQRATVSAEEQWLVRQPAVGLSYEGLPWFTGARPRLPAARRAIIGLALLYSSGALGIMTLNDFKAIEGDLKLGVRCCRRSWG